ncbi:hypothetical protein VTK26DRAFT_6329 [Humicola hyalothermophila]
MPSMISLGAARSGSFDPSTGRSSAPVFEFLCLFTHDLRRKQKRWQDGRLKYHTFNKRVMVYDERGNFVGDMHWQRDWDFDEGEEVQLERGGVIVQVQECVGRQNQDLTELLDKRALEKAQRQARAAVRPPLAAASPQTPGSDHFQTRHRPLYQLLGTPTGHHGRAVVPTESPFELRQRANELSVDRGDSHPSKRRKCDASPPSKLGYAQSLFGATLTLSSVPLSSAPLRRPISQARPQATLTEEAGISNAGSESHRSRDASESDVGSLTAHRIAPMPRVSTVANDDSSPNARDPAKPTTGVLDASHRRNVPSIPTTVRETRTGVADTPSNFIACDRVSANAANTEGSSRDLESGSNVRSSTRSVQTMQIGSRNGPRADGLPQLGASRARAIILDDDEAGTNSRKAGPGLCSRSQKVADNTVSVKERVASSVERGKPAERNNLPSLLAEPLRERSNNTEAASACGQAPPEEERTELRLKPRQKRGLLMLSEKKTKVKRVKQQSDVANEPEPNHNRWRSPTALTTSASDRGLDSGDSDPSSLCHDNPSSSSLKVSEHAKSGPPTDVAFSIDNERPQTEIVLDDDDAYTPVADATGSQHEDMSVDFPKRSESLSLATSKVDDEASNSSPPPQIRRTGRRTKASVKSPEELSGAMSPRSESSWTHAAPEMSEQDSPVRTRKAKAKDRAPSGRRRLQLAAGSESDEEEPPKPPTRPRLARLSRKSVRSREIIGYVSSSQRLTNLTSKPAFKAVCNTDEIFETHGIAPIGTTALEAVNALEPMDGTRPRSDGAERSTDRVPSHPPLRGDSTPAIQRQDSPSDGKTDEKAKVSGMGVESSERPSTRQFAGSSSREPTCSVEGSSSRNGATRAKPPVDAQQNITTTADIAAAALAQPSGANLEKHRSIEPSSLPLQSHKSRNPPGLGQHQHPIPDNPGIAPAAAGSPLAESRSNNTNNCVPPALPGPLPTGNCSIITTATITTKKAATTTNSSATTTTTSRPRIANPATRGRKAALRSDAAGQVPQPVLPSEPRQHQLLQGRVAASAERATTGGGGGGAGDVDERPKRTMRFPGFVSVSAATGVGEKVRGGGPWSREAWDLLECGRPSPG